MKTAIFSIGLSVILIGMADAQANRSVSPNAATDHLRSDVLVALDGTAYNQFRIVRTDPGGVLIRYVPEGGGMGMDRVPFRMLPENWRQQFNYDPKKAAQFDLEQQQALGYWRNKMIADERANREKWARLAAEEEAAEKAKRDAAAAKKAAEEAAALGTNAPAIPATNLPPLLDTNAPAILTNDVPTIQATNPPPVTVTNPPPAPPPPPRPRPFPRPQSTDL